MRIKHTALLSLTFLACSESSTISEPNRRSSDVYIDGKKINLKSNNDSVSYSMDSAYYKSRTLPREYIIEDLDNDTLSGLK